jgi:hypothetical protein
MLSTQVARPLPSRWTALRVLTFADLKVLWRSWLCRGFVIATALLTVLSLKGMEAEQKVASQMLEAVYVTYSAGLDAWRDLHCRRRPVA